MCVDRRSRVRGLLIRLKRVARGGCVWCKHPSRSDHKSHWVWRDPSLCTPSCLVFCAAALVRHSVRTPIAVSAMPVPVSWTPTTPSARSSATATAAPATAADAGRADATTAVIVAGARLAERGHTTAFIHSRASIRVPPAFARSPSDKAAYQQAYMTNFNTVLVQPRSGPAPQYISQRNGHPRLPRRTSPERSLSYREGQSDAQSGVPMGVMLGLNGQEEQVAEYTRGYQSVPRGYQSVPRR
jgi:hypothetical protein